MKDILELQKWIHGFEIVLEKAFYKVYAKVESNWIRLSEIDIVTEVNEHVSDAPMVELHYVYGHGDRVTNGKILYNLEEPEEYNCGFITSVIENGVGEEDIQ